jgi:hypothetical protein
MVQPAVPGDLLHQIEESGMHFVDAVSLFQPSHPFRPADRTPARRPHVVAITPLRELLPLTGAAFINSHVPEAFPEVAVDAPHLPSALTALHFLRL